MHNPTLNRRAFLAAATTTAAPTRPPNIVFILTDDLGLADLGCYGAKDIRPPAIDRLAAQGVRFTQCYSNGPLCSPTRAIDGQPDLWDGLRPVDVPGYSTDLFADRAVRFIEQQKSGPFFLYAAFNAPLPSSSPAHRYSHWPHLV